MTNQNFRGGGNACFMNRKENGDQGFKGIVEEQSKQQISKGYFTFKSSTLEYTW